MCRLNPFMNQVYFYGRAAEGGGCAAERCLNPFMNQVYFYMGGVAPNHEKGGYVLIPL